MQLKWSTSGDECLQFRDDETKVDSFFCDDDPAGEALWMLNEGKLQSWGDPSKCLYTDDSDEPKLQDCSGVAALDKWELPVQGGSFNNLRSKAREKCLIPVEGLGPRKVQLVPCKE